MAGIDEEAGGQGAGTVPQVPEDYMSLQGMRDYLQAPGFDSDFQGAATRDEPDDAQPAGDSPARIKAEDLTLLPTKPAKVFQNKDAGAGAAAGASGSNAGASSSTPPGNGQANEDAGNPPPNSDAPAAGGDGTAAPANGDGKKPGPEEVWPAGAPKLTDDYDQSSVEWTDPDGNQYEYRQVNQSDSDKTLQPGYWYLFVTPKDGQKQVLNRAVGSVWGEADMDSPDDLLSAWRESGLQDGPPETADGNPPAQGPEQPRIGAILSFLPSNGQQGDGGLQRAVIAPRILNNQPVPPGMALRMPSLDQTPFLLLSPEQQALRLEQHAKRLLAARSPEEQLAAMGVTPERLAKVAQFFDPSNPNGLVGMLNAPLIKFPMPSAEFLKNHPLIGGVLEGASDVASGFTSPLSIITMVATGGAGPVTKELLDLGFKALNVKQLVDQSKAFMDTKDPVEQARLATEIIFGASMMSKSRDETPGGIGVERAPGEGAPVGGGGGGGGDGEATTSPVPPQAPNGPSGARTQDATRPDFLKKPGSNVEPALVPAEGDANTGGIATTSQPDSLKPPGSEGPAPVLAGREERNSDPKSSGQGGGSNGSGNDVTPGQNPDFTKPKPGATPAPYKPVDTNPTKQPAPSPDFLKSLEEANEREKVSEEEVKQTSQLVDQATAELQDRITKAGCTVDTTTPTPEIAKYNPDTKTISLNLKRIAQIVKYVEEKRPGEGNDVVKATLSEEVTHAEIDNELKEGGENPVKYYAKVFIGLTNEQFKILRDVYGNLDTQIADSKEGPVPLDKQAALYGAEWLRIERMLARGEKIPQEFSVSSQKMARLLDEMNKWRIQHPSEKTIVP